MWGGALQHPAEGISQAAPFTAASLTGVLPERKTAATAAGPFAGSTNRHRGPAGYLLRRRKPATSGDPPAAASRFARSLRAARWVAPAANPT